MKSAPTRVERLVDAGRTPGLYEYFAVTCGRVVTLDPAYAYNATSRYPLLNLYESLVGFAGSACDRFVPLLATTVPTVENGLVQDYGTRYRFPVRPNVAFHSGEKLSAPDITYSLARQLLYCAPQTAGEILVGALFGPRARARVREGFVPDWSEVTRRITVVGGDVCLQLEEPFAPLLPILALWAPVVSLTPPEKGKDWDGTSEGWAEFVRPPHGHTRFHAGPCGTGPFRLEGWEVGRNLVWMVRFDGYWRGRSALARVGILTVNEYQEGKALLDAGYADSIVADRRREGEIRGTQDVEVVDDLPNMTSRVVVFNMAVAPESSHLLSGRLDGAGIPPDFFTDQHIRRGFAFAFDRQAYIARTFDGKASQLSGPIPPVLLGDAYPEPQLQHSLDHAGKEFRQAQGGEIWRKGFRVVIGCPDLSYIAIEAAANLKANLARLNRKFRIEIVTTNWTTYLDQMDRRCWPAFVVGWFCDYPDPHEPAEGFLASWGRIARLQGLARPDLDAEILAAARDMDPASRVQRYVRLQRKAEKEAFGIYAASNHLYRVQRRNVRGWFYNPAFPGTSFYSVFKVSRG